MNAIQGFPRTFSRYSSLSLKSLKKFLLEFVLKLSLDSFVYSSMDFFKNTSRCFNRNSTGDLFWNSFGNIYRASLSISMMFSGIPARYSFKSPSMFFFWKNFLYRSCRNFFGNSCNNSPRKCMKKSFLPEFMSSFRNCPCGFVCNISGNSFRYSFAGFICWSFSRNNI